MDTEMDSPAPMDTSSSNTGSSSFTTGPSLTWLDAAEVVLRDVSSKGLHITDLTSTILDRRLTQSSSKTSLETLLYRETLAGSRRFKRIAGKLGWFGLLTEEERKEAIEREGEEKPQLSARKRKHTQEDSEEEEEDSEMAEIERQKYRLLRRAVKEIVYENYAMASQLQVTEEKLARGKAERKFLLRRLLSYESGDVKPPIINKGKRYVERRIRRSQREENAAPLATSTPSPPPPSMGGSTTAVMPKLDYAAVLAGPGPQRGMMVPGQRPAKMLGAASPPPALLHDQRHHPNLSRPLSMATIQKKPLSAKESHYHPNKGERHSVFEKIPSKKASAAAANRSLKASAGGLKKAPPVIEPPAATGSGGKPKRKKPGMVKKRIQPIPVLSNGLPMFPIVLGGLTVHNLGTIVYDRPNFYSERYIWPIGFSSTRFYPSMKTPDTRTLYTCRICDNAEAPLFEMVGEDDPSNVISAPSATACLCLVLTAVNKARSKEATNTGSGPEFFGFSHPTIMNLIQHLPGADKCHKYNWAVFDPPRKVKDSAKHSYGSGVPSDTQLNPIPSSAAASKAGASAATASRYAKAPAAVSAGRPKATAFKGSGLAGPVYSRPAPAASADSNSGSGSDSGSSYYSGSSDDSGSGSESDTEAPQLAPQVVQRPPGYGQRPQLWQQGARGGGHGSARGHAYASGHAAQFLPQHTASGNYIPSMPALAPNQGPPATGQYESSETSSGSESDSSGSGSSSEGSEE